MIERTSIAPGVIIKHFARLALHPRIGAKLFKLELEKKFFGLLHPRTANGRAGRIRQVSFRITDLCNLRCHTCGQWGEHGFLHGKDLKELRAAEVPPARYKELLDDMVAHGHRPLIYFWGGEPMLYDGLLELVQKATRLGLPASIATNGTHIDRVAQELVSAPLFLLQISIDGPSASLHNAARPAAGGGDSFARILTALEAIRHHRNATRQDLPLIASLTVVSKANFRHLVDIYEAFHRKVDVLVFYLSWWIDENRALAHERDFHRHFGSCPATHRGWIGDWRPDDYRVLDRQLRELEARSRRWDSPPVTIIPPVAGEKNLAAYYTDHRNTFGFNRCVSIYQAVEVNSNGDVSPCRDYHDYVVGNLRHSTITELWNSEAYRVFRRSLSTEGLMPVCSRCCGLAGY